MSLGTTAFARLDMRRARVPTRSGPYDRGGRLAALAEPGHDGVADVACVPVERTKSKKPDDDQKTAKKGLRPAGLSAVESGRSPPPLFTPHRNDNTIRRSRRATGCHKKGFIACYAVRGMHGVC